jgi:hypothetical protein
MEFGPIVKPFGITVMKAVEKVVETDFSSFAAMTAVMSRRCNWMVLSPRETESGPWGVT